ncbi:hypothetical protein Syun_029485 [Stephania yunnanensis]|uniref:FAD-binding PCMH-type domain-containing protein n=1 Tax=Stephania yunnanensis TaxID=152371 RepID=A0AAP0HJW6_9MAGN
MSSSSSSSDRCIEKFLRCLSRHDPNILISTPNDSCYLSDLQRSIQNLRFCATQTPKVRRPQVVVTPLKESHVQAAVICSKECNLQMKIRGNGHDYEGLSYVSDVPFVVLDMLKLNNVEIDVKEGTTWVGGGATVGELYYNIAKKTPSHTFPSGICPTVGVGGHFSGGGFGTLVRKYGLSSDNIIDARLVSANGDILDRNSMGEDLFWAIRGGGGESFGVILAWKIKLVSIPKMVTVFDVAKTLEQGATSLTHKWQDIAHNLPDELYLKVLFQREKASQKEGSFTIKATFQALFLGETKQLLSIMEQWFPQLGVKSEHCKEMSWIQSILYSSSIDPNGPLEILLERTLDNPKFDTQLTRTRRMFFKSASDYVKAPLSESALEGIWKIFSDYSSAKHPYMLWSPSGGALGRVEPSGTPYPHRKNLYLIEYMVSWDEKGTEVADTNLTWLRRLYRYMEPYVSKAPREAYFNFRDLDLGRSKNGTTGATYDEAKAWGVKYFMGNFDRLVKVKNKVDPGNLFRSEQSINTQAETHLEMRASVGPGQRVMW